MSTITLPDIGLAEVTLETLPRLGRLRERHFSTTPAVCVELPRLMTEHLRQLEDEAEPVELRVAKRLRYVLQHKTPLIPDDDLFAGSTTTKSKGVVIYPQFMGQSLWPELETLSRRAKNPYHISREEIDVLDVEVFPHWMERTVQEVCRKEFDFPLGQRMTERLFFFLATKAHVISHTIPGYERVVEQGLGALIDQAREQLTERGTGPVYDAPKVFYKAVVLALEGVLAYGENLSRHAGKLAAQEGDPQRKKELDELARICARVPRERPQGFYEALQAIWLCHVSLHQENNNIALSLGRLDQMLYPLYKQDIEQGLLTPERAVELVGCFFLKLVDHVPMSPETAEELFGGSGSNQAVTVGGVDPAGRDAVNDLTYVMLRATELLRIRDPNVNARYHPEVNSRDYLERLCGVNVTTGATPCLHNDVEVIRTLTKRDYRKEDAYDYAIVGCVEPVRGGKTFGHSGAILLNLTSALELALFEGKHRLTGDEQFGPSTPPVDQLDGFDGFMGLFEQQLQFLIEQSAAINNMFGETHRRLHPLPLMSAFNDGPLEKGKGVLSGGATYNTSGVAIIGLAEVVDSLCAIREFVFEKGQVTFASLRRVIEQNWEGEEALRQQIIHSPAKFGTENDIAGRIAERVIEFLDTRYRAQQNYKGGHYTVGYWTMTTHAGWGVLTGALPSGRKKGEVLPSGITPVSGRAPVLTEALRFVAGLDSTRIANGHALNLKYTPQADPPKTITQLAAAIEAYMKLGGLQVQCNIIDRKTLEAAQQEPDKYADLLVRVSGYTAYFVDLNPHMQGEILDRAEYSPLTGEEVR